MDASRLVRTPQKLPSAASGVSTATRTSAGAARSTGSTTLSSPGVISRGASSQTAASRPVPAPNPGSTRTPARTATRPVGTSSHPTSRALQPGSPAASSRAPGTPSALAAPSVATSSTPVGSRIAGRHLASSTSAGTLNPTQVRRTLSISGGAASSSHHMMEASAPGPVPGPAPAAAACADVQVTPPRRSESSYAQGSLVDTPMQHQGEGLVAAKHRHKTISHAQYLEELRRAAEEV